MRGGGRDLLWKSILPLRLLSGVLKGVPKRGKGKKEGRNVPLNCSGIKFRVGQDRERERERAAAAAHTDGRDFHPV